MLKTSIWLSAVAVAAFLVVMKGSARSADLHARSSAAVAPADTTHGIYKSASEIASAVAATAATQGASPNAMIRVFQVGPYTVNVEHRLPLAQAAAVHDKEAELFVIVDGTATLVTGGTLVSPTRNGDNLSGPSIHGGRSQVMTKGDMMMIPPGVAHWITNVQGAFTPMTLHLPMP